MCRGYAVNKVQENVEAEIMNVVSEEAHEGYAAARVLEMNNDTLAEQQTNLQTVIAAFK